MLTCVVLPPENQRLLAPAKLESFCRLEAQGDEHLAGPPVSSLPFLHLPAHAVVRPPSKTAAVLRRDNRYG